MPDQDDELDALYGPIPQSTVDALIADVNQTKTPEQRKMNEYRLFDQVVMHVEDLAKVLNLPPDRPIINIEMRAGGGVVFTVK